MGMYNHGAIEKRSRRFTLFHYVCYGLGGLLACGAVLTHTWKLLLVALVIGLYGVPVRDHLTIHDKLISVVRAIWQRKRLKGIRRAAPLRRHPNRKSLSKLAQVGKAMAVVEENGEPMQLPMLTDPDGEYLTLELRVDGQSTAWLDGDSDQRMALDVELFEQLAKASNASKDPDVVIVQGRIYRPTDRESGVIYNHARLDPEVRIAGAASSVDLHKYDPVDVLAAKQTYDAQHYINSFAGTGMYYTAIRMRWPRAWSVKRFGRRKIDLLNQADFEKSSIWATISRVMQVYRNLDIKVRFMTDSELDDFYRTALNLSELPTLRYYSQRNRELREVLGETWTGEAMPYPVTVRSDTDGSGYIHCDGTYLAAGYATKLNRPDLPAGFQDELLIDLPDDMSYTFATWTELRPAKQSKRRAAGKEIVRNTILNNSPEFMSNPEAEMAVDDIVELRKRLAQAGGRASAFMPLFNVAATASEDVDSNWNNTVIDLGDTFDIQRVHAPDDIEDILLAQIGVKF